MIHKLLALLFVLGFIPTANAQRLHINHLSLSLRNCKVVLLGEPTHGESNVFEAKTELVKYLHDSLGYNIIAFESGFYDLHYAQRLIAAKPLRNSKEYLESSLFPVWTTSKSFNSFLEYYDRNKLALKIAGFDCQLTGDYSKSFFVDSALEAIKRYNPTAFLKIDADILNEAVDAFADNFSYPEELNYKDFHVQINAVISSLRAIKSKGGRTTNEIENISWLLQTAINIQSLGRDYYNKRGLDLNEKTFKAKDSNPRDSMMAQNLLALLKLYPGEKIICWGAGTHFMSDPSKVDNEELKSYKPMGMYLKNVLGADKVFNLTFISSGGGYSPPGEEIKSVPKPIEASVEGQLSKQASDTIIVLNSTNYQNKLFTSYCLDYKPVRANWSKLFDAFVYLRAFTPNTLNAPVNEVSMDSPVQVVERNLQNDLIGGRIIDGATNKPIAFADIINTRKNTQTQSNNNGEFQIPKQERNDTLLIHLLGYKTRKIILNENRIIHLIQAGTNLDEVKVSAKRMDVVDIIKKVKENYESNYGNSVFRQTIASNRTLKNFDSLIFDRDYIFDIYENVKLRKVMTLNCKETVPHKVSTDFLQKIGSIGVPEFNLGDLLRNGAIFKKNKYKKFDFQLLGSYSDSLEGIVYKIHFKAKKLSVQYTDDYFTQSYEGVLHVRKQDYAVLLVEKKLVRSVATLQKWTQKYYSPNNSDWNVFPELQVENHVVRYYKNPGTGLYHVKYSNKQWQVKGHLMPNQQPLQLIVDCSYYDLNNVSTIADVNSVPFQSFKFPYQTPYHPEFWNTFVFPKKNDRVYDPGFN